MTRRRKALMIKIFDGHPQILPDLYFIDPWLRCDEILVWLIENRLVGKEFLTWRKYLFGNSQLEMVQFILSKIDRSEKKPVFYGKDLTQ